ncbi:actin-related protein 2/3 complex subunit 5-like [Zophobas morio]|uniref:actin-related protein 2/3 complex subunit 5-like n=1 Tax=Zophobas morio TaxID=2755281 RepID=UPI0030834187
MSKSSRSNTHRQVDVDAYDKDRFVLEEGTQDLSGEFNTRKSEVRRLLNISNAPEALKFCLKNPLYSADRKTKDEMVKLVVEILSSMKNTEINKLAASLSSADIDICLKYVFKGMEFPDFAASCSAILLTWHKALVDAGGEGAIMRVLTDRSHCV